MRGKTTFVLLGLLALLQVSSARNLRNDAEIKRKLKDFLEAVQRDNEDETRDGESSSSSDDSDDDKTVESQSGSSDDGDKEETERTGSSSESKSDESDRGSNRQEDNGRSCDNNKCSPQGGYCSDAEDPYGDGYLCVCKIAEFWGGKYCDKFDPCNKTGTSTVENANCANTPAKPDCFITTANEAGMFCYEKSEFKKHEHKHNHQ